MLEPITTDEREKLAKVSKVPIQISSPADETADSALIRLAIANGCTTIRQFINRIPNLDRIDWNKRAVTCLLVSRLTDRPHWSVKEATPIVFLGCAEIDRFRAHGNRDKVQYCSMCLRDDVRIAEEISAFGPYVRGIWHLQTPRYCHRHANLMSSDCPRCSEPHSVQTIARGRCNCGYDLLDEPPTRLNWHDYLAEVVSLSGTGKVDFFRKGSRLSQRPDAEARTLARQQKIWNMLNHEARIAVQNRRAARSAAEYTGTIQKEPATQSAAVEIDPRLDLALESDFKDYAFAIMKRLNGKDFPLGYRALDSYPSIVRNRLLRSFERLETEL